MAITQTENGREMSRDSRLRESYDKEAERYDLVRYESREGRFFSHLEVGILKSWLPLGPGKRILDIPAGTGRLTVALSESGSTVIAADISRNMLHQAQRKAEGARAVRAKFVQGSGVQLPFPDETFDAVISFKFFHLIPNERKREFILEMTRVLKPGGSLIAEFNSPFYGGVLAAYRYYFRKRHPGGMRTKCLFPDQIPWLFEGLQVNRRLGVKLPGAGTISSVLGFDFAEKLDRFCGRLPGVRYFSYAIIVEAKKPVPQR